ncbi:unnamed protein product [Linum trigynum]|uniref:Uncharacterized protein n=1 Tax=Linum trigynum TaxID=586398 RepID=A0AAV2F5E4_9ROSI
MACPPEILWSGLSLSKSREILDLTTSTLKDLSSSTPGQPRRLRATAGSVFPLEGDPKRIEIETPALITGSPARRLELHGVRLGKRARFVRPSSEGRYPASGNDNVVEVDAGDDAGFGIGFGFDDEQHL